MRGGRERSNFFRANDVLRPVAEPLRATQLYLDEEPKENERRQEEWGREREREHAASIGVPQNLHTHRPNAERVKHAYTQPRRLYIFFLSARAPSFLPLYAVKF